jgi:hypothetical protein
MLQLFTALAVHVHGAGAALRGVAADVGAGQAQVLADEFDEQGLGRHVARHVAAVDLQREQGHVSPLWVVDAGASEAWQ